MPPDPTPAGLPDFAPGAIFGPYRIVRMLGRGGMGAVYEAEHQDDGRIVALKLLTVELDKMDSRERFLREGQTAATINHPNAVYIYGTEEIEGTPAITMELVPGGTLEDKVKANGPLPVNEAIEDILQVIDGLDAALAAGVLHRDVKPSNCFVGVNGAVKIGDFGLSKPVDSEEQQKLTKTGLFLGTPVYSSPEQLLGESLDARSDIYAVGVTLYHLLSAQLPYKSESMMQVVAAVLNGAPAPIATHRPDLPKNVAEVVMKAIARKPADRYQSYAEFRAAVVALRATDVAPATLWDRFRASIVDGIVLLILSWIITHTLLPELAVRQTRNDGVALWETVFLSLALSLLVIGIPEGLRGASIGKWLIGIRVVGANGLAAGYPRAAARILLLALTDFATLSVQNAMSTSGQKASASLLATLLFRSILLVTARRSNGRRLLHDFLSGTWVVRPRAAVTQRRGEVHRAVAPTLTGSERRIGPYAVLGPVRDGSAVLSAWEVTVRRSVWIVPQPVALAEASAARRTLSRLTRLRWVGGRREAGNSWDAFEAPVGESLSARLTRPVPWIVQRDWLLDSCNELIASHDDGTALGGLTADSLWVTPTDRIVFLEGESTVAASATPSTLIADLLDRIAAAHNTGTPLPRHAVRALAAARTKSDPREILAILSDTLGRPTEVTRLRRGSLIAATAAPIIAFSFVGWLTTAQGMKLDKDGFRRAGLISFVADSMDSDPDTLAKRGVAKEANSKPGPRIGSALRRLGLLPVQVRDSVTPPDTLRAYRKLAEVYLSTVHRAQLIDSNPRAVFDASPKDQRRAKLILDRNPVIDSATALAARVLVDSVWKGEIPGNDGSGLLSVIGLAIGGVLLYFAAIIALVVGVLARRGPLMRGFQVDLVTKNGEPAGRLRILARNIVTWSVALVPIVIMYLAPVLSISALATTIVIGSVLAVIASAAAMAYGVRNPGRGVAERLTGTWMVPE